MTKGVSTEVARGIAASGQEERTQSRFRRLVVIFFAPLILIAGLLEWMLWFTGDSWPITRVIERQEKSPDALFMREIFDQGFYRYKFLQILRRKPKILALGSSRVMQFRQEMFGARSSEFYNAGGMLQDLSDLKAFVDRLTPETAPEIVIIGLDLWWFNETKPPGEGFRDKWKEEAAAQWQAHIKAFRTIESSKGLKPLIPALRSRTANIGIHARTYGQGFRADGSMDYNLAIPKNAAGWRFVDRERPPVSQRIRNSSHQFPPSNGLSHARLAMLQESLRKLSARHVLVLGFLPPFSSESEGLLEANAGQSKLFHQFRDQVPKLFSGPDQILYDASTLSELGLNDSYMEDGMHAVETFHLHLIRKWLGNVEVARRFPGLDQSIDAELKSPKTNPWKPDYFTK